MHFSRVLIARLLTVGLMYKFEHVLGDGKGSVQI